MPMRRPAAWPTACSCWSGGLQACDTPRYGLVQVQFLLDPGETYLLADRPDDTVARAERAWSLAGIRERPPWLPSPCPASAKQGAGADRPAGRCRRRLGPCTE